MSSMSKAEPIAIIVAILFILTLVAFFLIYRHVTKTKTVTRNTDDSESSFEDTKTMYPVSSSPIDKTSVAIDLEIV
jgi:hypothetical protein